MKSLLLKIFYNIFKFTFTHCPQLNHPFIDYQMLINNSFYIWRRIIVYIYKSYNCKFFEKKGVKNGKAKGKVTTNWRAVKN